MRRLTGLALLTMLALLLAACGGDSGDDEPTEVSQPTQGATATEAGPEPTTPAATESTPDASPVTIATPGAATPVVNTPITETASTPIVTSPAASPAASPVAEPGGSEPGAAAASDGTGSAGTQILVGTVFLPGTANERFVISDDGCIGLDDYAGLQAGQQVIVRNEAGTVIGTANLASTSSAVVCSWTFEIEVPVSGYYVVSIPMRTEQAFTAGDVAAASGQIEITLP